MLQITPEMDAALDGQARWIVSIVSNYAAKRQNKSLDIEDILGGFILYYLRFRDKFDPERGRRTTFVFQLFRSYSFHRARKKRHSFANVHADLPLPVVEYDEDEQKLIIASQECRRESAVRYARDLNWSVKRTEETIESLRSKVETKQRKVRAFVQK